jgi:hypothetical protein
MSAGGTENGMRRMVLAVLFFGAPALAEKPVQGTGFTCQSGTGETRRFNIDLKKRRYDAGEGAKQVGAITDIKITLEAQNPDLMGDNGGLGPVFHTLELNRASLILTDQTIIPSKGTNRTTEYQCVMSGAINFALGRQF